MFIFKISFGEITKKIEDTKNIRSLNKTTDTVAILIEFTEKFYFSIKLKKNKKICY